MSAFTVVDDLDRVVLETDDWVDALSAAEAVNWPHGRARYVRGTHPSHDWGPPHPGQDPPGYRRCTRCTGWDNGSYGSQGPCGYNWDDALVSVLARERASREGS